ncbi:MAG TPA: ROK family protein [Arthrobacter sp.]|nr:ROK family protein [Arthrobacter sp.]
METVPTPVLGLDIGGTKLAAGVLMPDHTVAGLTIEPTRLAEGPASCIERLIRLGERAITAAGLDASAIGAAGISCGGPLDAAAGVLQAPVHLPGWADVPITDLVASAFRVPAVLENDATAGALGEYRFGAGRGAESMAYLTISTGIGGGAVLDGRLHHGAAGNGGEFGHQVVRMGGRKCKCGRNGCVEAYASGTAIAERATEAVQSGRLTSLSQLASITAADVAYLAGTDDLASELWNEAIDSLGEAVTNLVNILEPSVVVLGGGVTRSGKVLEPVRRAVAANAMGPAARICRIELAQLGQAACVAGAGAFAMDRLASLPPLSSEAI